MLNKSILNILFSLTIILLPFNNLNIPIPVDSFNLSSIFALMFCLLYVALFTRKIIHSKFFLILSILIMFFICSSLIMTAYFYILEDSVVERRNREMFFQVVKAFASFTFVFIHALFVYCSLDYLKFDKVLKYVKISNWFFITYALLEVSVYFGVISNQNIISLLKFINYSFNENYFIYSGGRIHGILSEPSVVTALVVLTYVPLYLSILSKGKNVSIEIPLLLILDIIFVLFTRGRTGIVAVCLMLVVYCANLFFSKRYKLLLIICFFSTVIFGIIISRFSMQAVEMIDRISTITNSQAEQSANTRWSLMIGGVESFLDYPILGIGPGNFGFIGSRYVVSKAKFSELQEISNDSSDFWLNPQSFIVKYLCEFGSMGIFIAGWITLIGIPYIKKIIKANSVFFLIIIPPYVIVSIGTVVYHNFYYFIPIMIILSILKDNNRINRLNIRL